MACQIYLSNCDRSNATGEKFGIYLDGDTTSVIVPCNARFQFDNMTGNTMLFQATRGRRYNVDLHKGNARTLIYGENWTRFVADYDLQEGDLVSFNLSGRMPRVYICYIRLDDENKELDDALQSAVFTKGIDLKEEEELNLNDLLPLKAGYVRAPFVHRFTKSNIEKKIMKVPRVVVDTLKIPGDGLAGIRLGKGTFRTVEYHTSDDGRIFFSKGWSDFVERKGCGTAVLISFKTSTRDELQIMVVVNVRSEEEEEQ